MCNKVELGMECVACAYPYAEAAFSDREGGMNPFPCNTDKKILREFIEKNNEFDFLDPAKVEAEIAGGSKGA